jgi:alkylated DNA repair dioxygenase AlkB
MNLNNLSFEDKINLMAATPPGPEKHALIQKLASTDTEFFKAYNASTMPLDQYMKLHMEEFRPVIEKVKTIRMNINNRGWTDKKYQKYTAELPEKLILDRPEFNAHLPRKTFGENVRAFLIKYPMFRVDR